MLRITYSMEQHKSDIIFCTYCGTIAPAKSTFFCTNCGQKLEITSAEISSPDNRKNGEIETVKHSVPVAIIIILVVIITLGVVIGAFVLNNGVDIYRGNSTQDPEEQDENEEQETLDYGWEIDLIATGTYIIDGDTFDVDSSDRIRLADVDAPENGENGFQVAKNCLSSLVLNQKVYLDVDDKYQTDGYGRLVAVAYVRYNATHLVNINQKMLNEGFAIVSNYDNQFNPSTWSLYVYYN